MKNVLGVRLDQLISQKIVDSIQEAEQEFVSMLNVQSNVHGGMPDADKVRGSYS